MRAVSADVCGPVTLTLALYKRLHRRYLGLRCMGNSWLGLFLAHPALPFRRARSRRIVEAVTWNRAESSYTEARPVVTARW